MTEQLNLAQLFDFVTQTLNQKRDDLNGADTYNHDHGDHVIEVFQLVTQVAKENPNLDAAGILSMASRLLSQKQTGTAQAYAQTMAQGAQQLQGKPLTQQTLPLLINALLGAAQQGGQQQPPAQQQSGGAADMLGGLLGALAGGGQQQQPQQPQQETGAGGMMGLLGALMGGGQQGGGLSDGLDMGDVLRAGSAFLQTSQSGGSTTEAALNALAAASGVGQTPHRAESAKVVVQALLQAAQQFGGK